MTGGLAGVLPWLPGVMLENGNRTCWLKGEEIHLHQNFSSNFELVVLLQNVLSGRGNVVSDGQAQDSTPWNACSIKAVDETVSGAIYTVLEVLGLDIRNASPIISDLPFVRSPTPVALAILSYLLAVLFCTVRIRRSGLKNPQRDPLPLKCLVIGHNLFLAMLSMYMGVGIIWEARTLGYSLWGNSYKEDEIKMGYYIYIFYVSKLYEFVDTGIMLLKRNLHQLSYLHIYHHASILFIWWIMVHRCPGGDAYFSAAFNSGIHVVMYSYYLLAAIISKDEAKRRKYLFWGKYLTLMQIVQFLSFIGQAVLGMFKPGLYPPGISRLLFFYSMSLLLFFSNFFVNKYFRPRASISYKVK
eukprot:TRINITY_DN506_c0_g1_i1.p1 TRINITY_DN506_c0_g1~~TRINITY_DN506_c0_g1_i1.p1  ORF type:complete len:356 (-),score=42.61 TRINITY_DN506_c0_g1_i1:624-1691(-)